MSPKNRALAVAIASVLAMIVLLFSIKISPARDLFCSPRTFADYCFVDLR
jgi:hypothetical protein